MKINQETFNNLYHMKEEDFHKHFEFLGEGISRKVFAINDRFVVKLAKGKEGEYQNKVENHVFTHANINLRKYLCPIACFNPKILIMERAKPLSDSIYTRFIDIKSIRPEKSVFNDLNKLADNFYLFYEDIISTSSWGKLNNENVLIDYGCTSFTGDFYYEFMFFCNNTVF